MPTEELDDTAVCSDDEDLNVDLGTVQHTNNDTVDNRGDSPANVTREKTTSKRLKRKSDVLKTSSGAFKVEENESLGKLVQM